MGNGRFGSIWIIFSGWHFQLNVETMGKVIICGGICFMFYMSNESKSVKSYHCTFPHVWAFCLVRLGQVFFSHRKFNFQLLSGLS